MRLRNLNELAVRGRERFNREFEFEDIVLPQSFRDKFQSIIRQGEVIIHFSDYAAVITTSQSKNIYLPNHWFLIAAYMAEFVSELLRYKSELDEIIKGTGINGKKDYFKDLRDNKAAIDPVFYEIISSRFDGDKTDTDYMIRFLTDYSWWFGNKTIDRPDFFVSPVLSLLNLVAVTQSYVADITYYYATNSLLKQEAGELAKNPQYRSSIGTKAPENLEEGVTGGKNLIIYGAPGTGKSYYIENHSGVKDENITRIIFHPEFTYHDFVGTYKPVTVRKNGDLYSDKDNFESSVIEYQYIPGPFARALKKALNSPSEMHLLLIEEINRANAAAVFGDLFQLLDRDQNGGSTYTIQTDEHLHIYLGMEKIFIPPNLHIFATMNSADQGVFVLDSAFKRRWNFKYLPIRFDETTVHRNEPIQYAGAVYTWETFATAINKRLGEIGINEDKHIGPYFMKPGEPSVPENIASKLLIYLWDDVVRYNRNQFFEPVATFSELVHNYYANKEIISSLNLEGKRISSLSEDEERDADDGQ